MGDKEEEDPLEVRRKRERRAEKLRREYERVGKEQNGIFESLTEYTHMVQAEVRALQITRDRISAQGEPKVRIGSPLILPGIWISWELATLGVLVCAVLGLMYGTLRGMKREGEVSQRSARHCSREEHPHED